MIKILIDIPQEQADHLALMAQRSGKPRSAIIREALTEYGANHGKDVSQGYGLWAGGAQTEDAQAYLDGFGPNGTGKASP